MSCLTPFMVSCRWIKYQLVFMLTYCELQGSWPSKRTRHRKSIVVQTTTPFCRCYKQILIYFFLNHWITDVAWLYYKSNTSIIQYIWRKKFLIAIQTQRLRSLIKENRSHGTLAQYTSGGNVSPKLLKPQSPFKKKL